MVCLSRQDLDKIYAQAAAEYPAECCGVLTAPAGGGRSRSHLCENIQDRLHAEDPQQYPRAARTAYYIDPQELYNIISTAEKSGGSVSGFYHSHIDCEAYFSDEDKERAKKLGAVEYFVKSNTPITEIIKKVTDVLK